uniref:Env protein n=1 Tax=Rabbit endogenous lentivirus type K TaxID=596477 RepID=A0A3Q9T7J5_9RETR|nr:env protein [Rabbit endogenous lentivirus type K]AZY88395.1 env protein [Rabbit endogenous lentivirus type K]
MATAAANGEMYFKGREAKDLYEQYALKRVNEEENPLLVNPFEGLPEDQQDELAARQQAHLQQVKEELKRWDSDKGKLIEGKRTLKRFKILGNLMKLWERFELPMLRAYGLIMIIIILIIWPSVKTEEQVLGLVENPPAYTYPDVNNVPFTCESNVPRSGCEPTGTLSLIKTEVKNYTIPWLTRAKELVGPWRDLIERFLSSNCKRSKIECGNYTCHAHNNYTNWTCSGVVPKLTGPLNLITKQSISFLTDAGSMECIDITEIKKNTPLTYTMRGCPLEGTIYEACDELKQTMFEAGLSRLCVRPPFALIKCLEYKTYSLSRDDKFYWGKPNCTSWVATTCTEEIPFLGPDLTLLGLEHSYLEPYVNNTKERMDYSEWETAFAHDIDPSLTITKIQGHINCSWVAVKDSLVWMTFKQNRGVQIGEGQEKDLERISHVECSFYYENESYYLNESNIPLHLSTPDFGYSMYMNETYKIQWSTIRDEFSVSFICKNGSEHRYIRCRPPSNNQSTHCFWQAGYEMFHKHFVKTPVREDPGNWTCRTEGEVLYARCTHPLDSKKEIHCYIRDLEWEKRMITFLAAYMVVKATPFTYVPVNMSDLTIPIKPMRKKRDFGVTAAIVTTAVSAATVAGAVTGALALSTTQIQGDALESLLKIIQEQQAQLGDQSALLKTHAMGLQMLEAHAVQIEQIITILALERELKCETTGRVCITTIPWNNLSIPNATQLADMFKHNHSTWLEWVNATAHLEANITKRALQIIQLQNIAAFKIDQVKTVEQAIHILTDTVSSWLPSWKWFKIGAIFCMVLVCLPILQHLFSIGRNFAKGYLALRKTPSPPETEEEEKERKRIPNLEIKPGYAQECSSPGPSSSTGFAGL